MPSDQFTPEDAKKQQRLDNLAKARKAKADKKAKPAETKPKVDKLAAARARREQSEANFRKSGALHGQKLYAPERPGYHRHWVNDDSMSVDEASGLGYSHVHEGELNAPFEAESDAQGSKISRRVGFKDGQPLYAFLMEQPEEFHKLDQQRQEAETQDASDSVRSGSALGSEAYVPDGASQYELPGKEVRK